ncbi:MAG: right-handed parallel beta-helix repeat-containing protein [Bacteroidales bacterium]|nr:right-handed parallel beta-helix repeat-containing protein [Bacteroidales bacterium]
MKTKALLTVFFFICIASTAQWIQQESHTTNSIYDTHFINDSVGFAVGANGIFLKTFNRGQDWDCSNPFGSETLRTVFAFNPDTLLAGGYDHIYKSNDGGDSWMIINDQLEVNELKFFSSQVGFAKALWEEQCPYPNQGTAWRAKYFRTLDGGNTWEEFGLFSENTALQTELRIITPDTGYIGSLTIGFWCGYWPCCESNGDYFFKTTDGGITWQPVNNDYGYGGFLYDVSLMNGFEGNALKGHFTPYGTFQPTDLYRIRQGGEEIEYIHGLPEVEVDNFFFANQFEGYYSAGNTIMKTATGGLFWEEDHSGDHLVREMVMTSGYEAYAVGANGMILHKKINPVTEPEDIYWISCNKSTLSFPNTNIHENTTLNFTLTASGNQPITVNITASTDFMVKTEGADEFTEGLENLTIPAAHDTVITVSFNPSDNLNYSDTLIITSNSTNNPLIQIALTGKGICFLPAEIHTDTMFCYDSIWVRSDVTIAPGIRTTICPGTKVVFRGNYRIVADGSLNAVGGEGVDWIQFITESPGIKWAGMDISGDYPADSVILNYCSFTNSQGNNIAGQGSGGALNITGNRNGEISNCWFYDCSSIDYGGAVYCTSPGFIIRDSEIISCTAKKGGGIYYKANRPHAISGCHFEGCEVTDYGNGYGGGIYFESDADSVIMNCSMNNCQADNGGGVYTSGNGYSIHNGVITLCNALKGGGGLYAGPSESAAIQGWRIEDCTAYSGAGVFLSYLANLELLDCESTSCKAIYAGGGICISGPDNVKIKNCLVNGNKVASQGYGAGIYIFYSKPEIRDCNILANDAFNSSGGGIYSIGQAPIIIGNIFQRNVADQDGAGIYHTSYDMSDTLLIIQNLFFLNISNYGKGGGIFLDQAVGKIYHNTLSLNEANYDAGDGIYCSQPVDLKFKGNIVYNNGESEIYSDNLSGLVLENNDIKGGWQGIGSGNIDLDPMFYSMDSFAGNEQYYDFSLQPGSPCIDYMTGDTTGLGLPGTDLIGNPRVIGGLPDIGAYENNFIYQSFNTSVCNGQSVTLEAIPIHPGPFDEIQWEFNGTEIPGALSSVLEISNFTIYNAGYYRCIFTIEDHLLYSRQVALKYIESGPVALTQPVGATLNSGDNYSMTFYVQTLYSHINYQWYLNDSLLDGENSRTIDIYNFSKEKQGAYKCLAENSCGGLFSDIVYLLINSAGIDEVDAQDFQLYPNPAVNQLIVDSRQSSVVSRQHVQDLPEASEGSSVRILLINIFGQVLAELCDVQSFPYQLNISALSPGMYILRIEDEEGHAISARFVKAEN